MAVKLSALRARSSLPPGRFLVLISVEGWVDPRAIVRLEGLGQLKNPMTSSGIEPATFQACINVLPSEGCRTLRGLWWVLSNGRMTISREKPKKLGEKNPLDFFHCYSNIRVSHSELKPLFRGKKHHELIIGMNKLLLSDLKVNL
jgi:hypothetical protein